MAFSLPAYTSRGRETKPTEKLRQANLPRLLKAYEEEEARAYELGKRLYRSISSLYPTDIVYGYLMEWLPVYENVVRINEQLVRHIQGPELTSQQDRFDQVAGKFTELHLYAEKYLVDQKFAPPVKKEKVTPFTFKKQKPKGAPLTKEEYQRKVDVSN